MEYEREETFLLEAPLQVGGWWSTRWENDFRETKWIILKVAYVKQRK